MVTFRGAEPQTLLAPAICAAPYPARFRPTAPVSGSRSAAARRPPAAGRRASQSAAARGSMPAGAPPLLGRMAQAGRPAGAHILWPGFGARVPAPGGDPAKAAASAAGPEGAHSCAAAARQGSAERLLRPPGWREGGPAAPPRTVRVSCLQSEPRAERATWSGVGVVGGDAGEHRSLQHASGSGGSTRAPRPARAAQVGRGLRLSARSADGRGAGGGQEAGTGGALGEGAVERRAWGRAAAARRRGGARGSRGPAARAHRARRRAARAARPPPSARLPLRALAPASPSGSQLRPPGPAHVTRFPAPPTGA